MSGNNVRYDTQTAQRLLEIAANNDVDGLRDLIQRIDPACVNAVGLWNGLRRTPLMVAAAHGNVAIVNELISSCKAELDLSCGYERVTALHCAASIGAVLKVVKLLLDAGANPDKANVFGLLPRDIVAGSGSQYSRMMKNMLTMDTSPVSHARNELFLQAFKVYECHVQEPHREEMCAFFHPCEGDRRRNPRQHRYVRRICDEDLVGGCPQGDECGLSHGVYEYRLHPKKFKKTLCESGAMCRKIACFKAHSQRECRLINRAPLLKLPVMQLNEEQQQIFLNAERFTKYFLRRFPADFIPYV